MSRCTDTPWSKLLHHCSKMGSSTTGVQEKQKFQLHKLDFNKHNFTIAATTFNWPTNWQSDLIKLLVQTAITISEKWIQCRSVVSLRSSYRQGNYTVCMKVNEKMSLFLTWFMSSVHWVSKTFMVSVSSFKSSSIQHDVHFVDYGPSYFKIDDKVGRALGRGYLVIQTFGSWM